MTNPTEQAAREFWIDEKEFDCLRSVFEKPVSGCVHVIEHAAYLSALKRAEVAEAKVLAFEGMTFSENEELAVLRAKLAKAVEQRDDSIGRDIDSGSGQAIIIGAYDAELDAITADTLKKGEEGK